MRTCARVARRAEAGTLRARRLSLRRVTEVHLPREELHLNSLQLSSARLAVALLACACQEQPAIAPALDSGLPQEEVDTGTNRIWNLWEDTRERRAALVAERASTAQPPWAGSYRSPVGYDSHWFEIAEQGFIYEFRTCTGSMILARGSVTSKDGSLLVFEPEFCIDVLGPPEVRPDRRRDFRWEREMYSVVWDDERFLVPKSLMPDFCANVFGKEFLSIQFADNPRRLRPDETNTQRHPDLPGLPVVPEQFRRFLPE